MSAFPTGWDPADAAFPVRLARGEDLDDLVALENAAFATDRLSRRSFTRLLGVHSAVVLVVGAARGLAGAAVLLLRSYSKRARLYSLAVSPAMVGKGIGSKLLAAAEDAAFGRGVEWLTLEVRDDNAAARSLYARRGYDFVGQTADYYSDGAAALHFCKRLQNRSTAQGEGA